MQQTKVDKLPVRRSEKGDTFPVKGELKGGREGFHVHVMIRIEILFCIQIVLIHVFYSAAHLKKGEMEYSGY
ncbi:hypothetical protein, partial [Serratia sp. OS31]|uniref:hypothetical protein n=1 Tax=Serratia sp. OS31 TaxID=2760844 RepID=UPI001C71D82C